MRTLRLVIAEDTVLLREGLVGLLERFGHTVLAAVGDATSLVDAVAEHRPEAIIVDVRMPPDNTDDGLRAVHLLRDRYPQLAVVVLSQYVSQGYAAEMFGAKPSGAGMGYLLKDRIGEVQEFLAALDAVAGGGTVIDPEVVRQLLARRHAPVERLSPKEREVLQLIAEGRSNAAVAQKLVVSEATVAKRIAAIFVKLDLPPTLEDHRRVLAVLAYLNS